MQPGDYWDAPLNKVLHSIGLFGGCSQGEAQQITDGHGALASVAHPLFIYLFIHSYTGLLLHNKMEIHN
jgi:hypothetical protein